MKKRILTVNEAAILVVKNALHNADALKTFTTNSKHARSKSLCNTENTQTQLVETCAASHDVQFKLDCRYRWKPHENEILVRVARELPAGAKAPLDLLMQLLGWDRIADPDKKVKEKVRVKFNTARAHIANGKDPLQVGSKRQRIVNRANTWTVWMCRAFESLPDQQGTLEDVCVAMQADPDIAPLLDTRPDPSYRNVPRWRRAVASRLNSMPGLTNTGGKRGRRAVYRFRPQDIITPAVSKRAPKRGQPGLPYLGKKSKNTN